MGRDGMGRVNREERKWRGAREDEWWWDGGVHGDDDVIDNGSRGVWVSG